jgi:hypothetical protein
MDLVPSAPGNGQTFTGLTLSGATIVNSSISGSTFVGGTLSGTTILGGTVSGTTLLATTVSGAVIFSSTLSGATIVNSTINSGSTVNSYATTARQFVSVNRGGSSQSITSGTDVKVQHTTELADADGVFDSVTNYRMTPTVSGTFLVVTAVEFVNLDTNDYAESQIWKTGSKVAYVRIPIAGTGVNRSSTCSALVTVNGSTDYIEHYVHHDHGTSRNIAGDAVNTYMHAIWVSR